MVLKLFMDIGVTERFEMSGVPREETWEYFVWKVKNIGIW